MGDHRRATWFGRGRTSLKTLKRLSGLCRFEGRQARAENDRGHGSAQGFSVHYSVFQPSVLNEFCCHALAGGLNSLHEI